jgi:hypothetical protein
MQQETAVPEWTGDAPVNYEDIRDGFVLAMSANDEIDADQIETVVGTVDEAVVNNERELEWGDDA